MRIFKIRLNKLLKLTFAIIFLMGLGQVQAEVEAEKNMPTKIQEVRESQQTLKFPGKTKKYQKHRRYLGTPPCLSWIDLQSDPKAVLLCVHGLGLHNGTYKEFGERMSSLGWAIYAVDVRGFGSWQEAQGHEKVDFQGCLEDVHQTLKILQKAHPKVPLFLLGESMGGAIALRVAALYPDLIRGLISSVPAGDRFRQGSTNVKIAFRLLEGKNKQFNIGTQIVEQASENNPALKKRWIADPLARLKLSPRELIQFQRFMNQNHVTARKIKDLPVLMIQGCRDKLVRPEGTIELYNKLATTDRQLVLIPQAGHLIFEENQFTNEVIDTLHQWLLKHLKTDQNAQSA